tara:strand:- start:1335 stop:1550 length:216 start_codon:yes stop_codon:yes gene_type:complete
MKRFANPVLSFAAPLLICLSLLGLSQRESSDRLKSLPGILIGSGLIISGAVSRRERRRKLLLSIRKGSSCD